MPERETAIPWPNWKICRHLGKGSFGNVYEIERIMGEELKQLGFTDFRVQKVMLRDIYVIHKPKSLFPGKMTTSTATDPVYTLHFSLSW